MGASTQPPACAMYAVPRQEGQYNRYGELASFVHQPHRDSIDTTNLRLLSIVPEPNVLYGGAHSTHWSPQNKTRAKLLVTTCKVKRNYSLLIGLHYAHGQETKMK